MPQIFNTPKVEHEQLCSCLVVAVFCQRSVDVVIGVAVVAVVARQKILRAISPPCR